MALSTETLPGIPGGMNLAIPAQELDDTEAKYLQDALVDRPGLTRSRGPAQAVSTLPRPTNKGSALLVCADPNGAGRFGVLHGDNSNGYLGMIDNLLTGLTNFTWVHAFPASPASGVANAFRNVDSKPALVGGAWIGASARFAGDSPSQSLAYWHGGYKATYSTGTIAFQGGGLVITGTGTSFTANVSPGMFIFATVANTAAAPSPNYFGAGIKTLIGVVKTVNSDTSITMVNPAPYSSSGTLYIEPTPTAVTYEIMPVRGFAPKIAKGLITCSTTSTTVTGGGTKWVQQGLPTTTEGSRTTNYWNIYRLSDSNWVGRVSQVNSDTSLTLNANANVSLVDEPYIAIRGDSNWNVLLTTSVGKVGWLNAAYAERQWYANLGTAVDFAARLWFSDPSDPEATDLATYNGDFIDIPSTVSTVEPIRGLLQTYNALMVFKETETYAVYGNTPTSFNVRKLEDDGVFHPMGVQPFGGGAIWPGRNGIYFYDGITVRNLTAAKLGTVYKNAVRQVDFDQYRTWSMMSRSHYFLFFEAITPEVVPRKGNVAQPVTTWCIVINMVTEAVSLHTGINLRGSVVLPQTSARQAWFLVNGADTARPDSSLGKTATGATPRNLAANTIYAAKMVTATADGYTPRAVWRLDGNGTGSGTATLRAALYANNAGEPGALIEYTDEVSVADAAAAANLNFTFRIPKRLVNGTSYWIALHAGTNGDNVRAFYDSSASVSRTDTDTYSDGVPATWDVAGDTTDSFDMTAYLAYDYDRAVICDSEALFDLEGLDSAVADGGAPTTGYPGPDIFIETKKFDIGDGLRLKRFKQFSIHYLAQGGGVSMDTVVGLNEVGTTLTTVFPSSIYNWNQLGNLFLSWDDLAEEFATWSDIISAVFLPRRARFSKKSQYFSIRLYRETPYVNRLQFGPYQLGFKTLRAGRI
jgi:hypothetical protein